MNPRRWILAGTVLMLMGWALAFLMVLRVLPLSFLLAFLALTASTTGFLVGMLGLLFAQRTWRRE